MLSNRLATVLLGVALLVSMLVQPVKACSLKIGPTWVEANPAAGKRLYFRCAVCHSLDSESRPLVGPNLSSMFSGRPLAAPGYAYSNAFRKAAPTWTDLELLDRFLEKPSGAVSGTKMIFAGIKSAQDRANLIAFLKKETHADVCE